MLMGFYHQMCVRTALRLIYQVFQKLIPKEYILPTLDVLRSFGLHRAYHTYERVYVDNNTPRARKWYRPPVPPAIEVEDVASLYPRICIKVAGIGDAETLRDKRREL